MVDDPSQEDISLKELKTISNFEIYNGWGGSARYDVVNKETNKDVEQEQKFRYVGTLDSKTRDECRNTLALSQKEFTMEEINDLTTGVSFADGGGFNCRHEWIPV